MLQSTGHIFVAGLASQVPQSTGQLRMWSSKAHLLGSQLIASTAPLHVVAVRSVTMFALLQPTDKVLQTSGSRWSLHNAGGSDWQDWHLTGHAMTMATAGHDEQSTGHVALTPGSPQSSRLYTYAVAPSSFRPDPGGEHSAGSLLLLQVFQPSRTSRGGIASSQSKSARKSQILGSAFPRHTSYSASGSGVSAAVVLVVVVVIVVVVSVVDVTVVEVVVVFVVTVREVVVRVVRVVVVDVEYTVVVEQSLW